MRKHRNLFVCQPHSIPIMATKIYMTLLAILFVCCLGYGFYLGFAHVFAPQAFTVRGQDSTATAGTPPASAPAQ